MLNPAFSTAFIRIVQLMVDGGGMYFMFSSKFVGLYEMRTAIKDGETSVERVVMEGCPSCAGFLFLSRNQI